MNRMFSRLLVSILAGSCCGLVLGGMMVAFEYVFFGPHDGFTNLSYYISDSLLTYSLNGLAWGGIGGGLDFLFSIAWPKTTGLLCRTLLWVIIAGGIFGILIACGGWPQYGIAIKSLLLAVFCCLGAFFGAATTFAVQRTIGAIPKTDERRVDEGA